VVLDEATNAISSDIEAYLFDLLKKKKFAFITLSHRPLLIKYHDYLLEILENGNWVFETLGSDAAIISIDKEIKVIKDKLHDVSKLEHRKIQLEALLDGDELLEEDEVQEVSEVSESVNETNPPDQIKKPTTVSTKPTTKKKIFNHNKTSKPESKSKSKGNGK
jgi:ATP-binding cassette subfamily D (ALD) long-chain fatty acid import protein